MANLLGSTPGIIVGVGVGAAASAALEPAIEIPKQEAWARNANKLLNAGLMARLVAQGGIELDSGRASALREGYANDKFDHLVYLEQTVPGVSEALALWRLGLLTDELFEHVLVKAGLDQRYVPALIRRKTAEVIGLGDIATAIIRSALPTPSWVPVGPPTSGTTIPRYEQVQLDPVELAARLGFDEDMLRIVTARSGLSLAPVMAANAYFRELITLADAHLAAAEGDLRTEWMDTVIDTARQIPTALQFVEAQVRGQATRAARLAGTRKHGMSDGDSELLYEISGRGITPHAITTGLARGGKYPGSYANVPEPYKGSIERALTREEFSELAYANRYGYPSGFMIRAEAQAHRLTEPQTEQILLEVGWAPQWAAHFAASWTATSGAAAKEATKTELADEYAGGYITEDELRAALEALGYTGAELDHEVHLNDARRIKRWREKAVDAIAAAYSNFKIDDQTATTELAQLNVLGDAATMLLSIWRLYRLDRITLLTPPQVKKAYTKGLIDQATALAELEDRGYSPSDATELLAE